MKIAIIFGTRPEIIKMAPVIRECIKRNINFITIHSGQHYSYELDKIFFEELDLPTPNYNLNIKSKAPYRQAEHTGRMLIEIEDILLKEEPNILLVHGDTNTALSGALISKKISTTKNSTGKFICVGHVEAGLRSYDQFMTEEINRVICDHLSDFLFCPTKIAKDNILKEGINESKIMLTGNTIVDSVYQNLELGCKKTNILKELNLKEKEYILVTAHRQENVDVRKKLENIIEALVKIKNKFNLPVIFPMHPRTKNFIEHYKITIPSEITVIKPLGFLEFLVLESKAKLLITDSGGVQEEGCIFNVPCVTLRENTERPETLEIGANILAGTNTDTIIESAGKMITQNIKWENPFGDGHSAEKIIDILQEKIN
jgi:UDP-N-acetylglucosamine 2-epimerase (non-hydrolysing)